MLGPLAFARLKSAEDALRAGRLDEAYELLATGDVRNHPRAKDVLAGLANAFEERVRVHEEQGRYAEALRDLDRAAACGAKPDAVGPVREWIAGLARQQQQDDQAQRQQIEAARARIDAGSLAAGREMLADLDAGDAIVRRLNEQAEQRERGADRSLADARRLLEAGQWGPACRALERARGQNPRADGLTALEVDVVEGVLSHVSDAASAGRLDTAADMLGQLGGIGRGLPQRSEWERVFEEIRQAGDAVRRADWAAARRTVLRLKARLPKAEWIAQAAEQLDQLDDLTTAIHAGPLGLSLGPACGAGAPVSGATLPLLPPVVRPPVVRAPGGVRYRLLVDGVGSFLVLAQSRVTIGRAGSGDWPVDVALMADISTNHAEIARVEDDYFLFAHKALLVNGRATGQRLLENGDQIELSRRARLTFRQPSRRSASAVLELGGSLRLNGDVRRVVLFDRYATLGPGAENHIVVPNARGAVAVYEKGGAMYARTTPAIGSSEAVALRPGEPMEIGGMRMVLRAE